MTDGLLERAARMVTRKGLKFGAATSSSDDMPTPATHYMRPVIHTNPSNNRPQIASPPQRSLT